MFEAAGLGMFPLSKLNGGLQVKVKPVGDVGLPPIVTVENTGIV